MTISHEERPWGAFYVLVDQDNTKVKRLVVNPGHRLSLQSHMQRDEHWVITRGKALINLDDETLEVGYGTHVYIKRGVKHRVSCVGNEVLEIVEVQTGDAFPEEDIVRYQDDYKRAP